MPEILTPVNHAMLQREAVRFQTQGFSRSASLPAREKCQGKKHIQTEVILLIDRPNVASTSHKTTIQSEEEYNAEHNGIEVVEEPIDVDAGNAVDGRDVEETAEEQLSKSL